MTGTTLFEKIWSAHTVSALPGNRNAVVIDRMTVHELGGGIALRDMMRSGVSPYMRPYQVFGVADHTVSTAPDRGPYSSLSKAGTEMIQALEESCSAFGYRYGAPDELSQGICHVAGPEQGFVLPGTTHVCCDSHTCTIGAFGTLAFAVGSSEVTTVLKRGALIIQRPKTLRITVTGALADHVSAKDVALHILAQHGVRTALGAVIEFAGPAVAAMSMEARMTLCNMAAEMGTRYALIAPDEVTFDYLRLRLPAEPALIEAAITAWRGLRSDDDAVFGGELAVDVGELGPQVTWGTNPEQTVEVGQNVPAGLDEAALAKSRSYMQLQPGAAMTSIPIDAAFIGSCTNGRLSDLRAAAAILQGRTVAPGIHAMCTPGSMLVRAQAEAEGLDKIFLAAGFEWRKAGCSACPGREGPIWADKRVISTTNRNFENRQGPRTRTHLARPGDRGRLRHHGADRRPTNASPTLNPDTRSMPAPLAHLHAIAMPMPRDNIDTDELIPVFENTRTVQDRGWGDGLFAGQRYLDGSGHTPNPGFILNQAPFDKARIIVAGANFGCGSSRESAAWALRDYGFRVILAASFNETFKRNAVGNGLAPLVVSPQDLQALQAAISEDPQRGLMVDLPAGSIVVGGADAEGATFAFELDPYECALLTTGRTEDDMLEDLQRAVDVRRDGLLGQAPWLGSISPP